MHGHMTVNFDSSEYVRYAALNSFDWKASLGVLYSLCSLASTL